MGEIGAVEKWIVPGRNGGDDYVCFRDERGDLFHFKRAKLMRGKPLPAYRTLDEVTRTYDMLTLANASHISGLGIDCLRRYIYRAELPAVKKRWRYGNIRREGWMVKLKDLRELMMKRAIQKFTKGEVEWDISPQQVMEGK